MTISTLDQLFAAAVQRLVISKTAGATAVAQMPTSVLAQAGTPGAGVLAGTSTTTGVVPTDATAGFPPINAFGGSNRGLISRIEWSSDVAGRIALYDCLWKGGAFPYNAAVSGSTPASYSSRIPGGSDYTGLELWYEQVTVGTLVQNVNVTYTDDGGTTGRTTGVTAMPAAMAVGRMAQLPLAAGDKGIRGVTGVAGSVASAGTFNILVLRPLGEARIRNAGDSVIHDVWSTGWPEVWSDSALMQRVTPDSTSTGKSECIIDIRNG